MKERFGSYQVSKHKATFCTCGVLLFVGVYSCICTGSMGIVLLLSVLCAMMLAYSTVAPHLERFELRNGLIKVQKLRRCREIAIPPEAVIVISDADINTILANRNQLGLELGLNTLSGEYAVSILEAMPPEIVMEKLHKLNTKRYTNCLIEDLFSYQFIYSFVCDEDSLNNLLSDFNYGVIVPASLEPRFRHILACKKNAKIYIDG